jgi:hypothetical protein
MMRLSPAAVAAAVLELCVLLASCAGTDPNPSRPGESSQEGRLTLASSQGVEHEERRVRTLRTRLVDEEGVPYAGAAYLLRIGGRTFTGVSDETGRIAVEVPIDLGVDGELTVTLDGESYRWPLKIGRD